MSYRVPVMEKFAYQDPILAVADAPVITAKGTRYLVGATPSGDFVGHANAVAWTNGTTWFFDAPVEGWVVYDKATKPTLKYDGANWSGKVVTGDLAIGGNISTETQPTIWQLKDKEASALSFDTDGKTGMLVFTTLDGAEKVSVGADMLVDGDLTVNGTVTYINSTNLEITDKLLTVNKGGTADSGGGAGFQIEELSADGTSVTNPGYIKTNSGAINDKWLVKAPDGSELTIAATAASILTIAGNLDVEAASKINQDLTTDATGVQFADLTLTGALGAGSAAITGNATVGGTLGVTGDATLSAALGVVGNATVGGTLGVTGATTLSSTLGVTGNTTVGGTLGVTGLTTLADADVTGTFDVTGLASFAADVLISTKLTDGTKNITVAQAAQSYASRAQYDDTLACIVFDDAAIEHIA